MTELAPILLAEDNEDDILLMRKAFTAAGILARCSVSVPLRADIDPTAFVSWLTNSGARVALSPPANPAVA